MKKTLLLSTLAVSLIALTSSVEAAKTKGMEKCYGVVKSGYGTTEATGSGEFIYLPKGTCGKLTNGSVTFVETKGTTAGGTTTTTTETTSETKSTEGSTTSDASADATTKTSGYNTQTTGAEVTMTKATGTTSGSETTTEGKN